eukprot:166942_1
MDKQKMLDEIVTMFSKVSRDQDTLEKVCRTAKNHYNKQKIEIESQFEMIVNMLKATEQQLLTNLEQKHKAQQQELNGKISQLNQYVKQFRTEYTEKTNHDDITQICDIHDRVRKEFDAIFARQYVHTHINVVMDTSMIMSGIQKIAYIQEATKEEMTREQEFAFHCDNKNLIVKPQIIALNTNSMNTKICVSWKLNPSRMKMTDEVKVLEDIDLNEDERVHTTRQRTHSLSMTDDIDTSNMSMNVHDICSIDIEWRYSDDQEEILKHNKKKKKKKKKKKEETRHNWNILDVDHHKILAFDLDTSIFDHILNTTRYGIYYFRITLYNRNSKISCKQMMITTFRVKIRHIADEWNLEYKQKQLRIGYFNRKIVTRDIPGEFRHIFGTLIVSRGVNLWTLKVKKHDPNRDKCSAMIGVVNMNNRHNLQKLKSLNQCFAHSGFGYGLYLANGDVYHTKQPRVFGREVKEGDVVQIMCDYREHTVSFIVNNISWGIAFDRSHFAANKLPHLGLAVALRGCDEIQLCDFVNEHQSLLGRKRSSSSTSTGHATAKPKGKRALTLPGSSPRSSNPYGQLQA